MPLIDQTVGIFFERGGFFGLGVLQFIHIYVVSLVLLFGVVFSEDVLLQFVHSVGVLGVLALACSSVHSYLSRLCMVPG
jgi:hypothetical protein